MRTRRARFASLVDRTGDGVGRHSLARLDSVTSRLRALRSAEPAPDPRFRAELRARLAAAAAETPVLQPRSQQPSTHRRPPPSRRPLLAAGLLLVLIAGGTVWAGRSHSVDPDEVRRAAETAQLRMAAKEQARGEIALDAAHERVRELDRLLSEHDRDIAAINRAVRAMNDDTRAGLFLLTRAYARTSDPAHLLRLEAFAADQRTWLSAILPRLPTLARSPVSDSLVLVSGIGDRATAMIGEGCSGPECTGRDAAPSAPGGPDADSRSPSPRPTDTEKPADPYDTPGPRPVTTPLWPTLWPTPPFSR